MRPSRKILLLAKTDYSASVLRFTLIQRLWRVTVTTTKRETAELLKAKMYDLLLVEYPHSVDVSKFELPYRIPVIEFGAAQPVHSVADHFLISGDAFSARLIETIKLALIRKRGPRPKEEVA